jgi:hypothetical protein
MTWQPKQLTQKQRVERRVERGRLLEEGKMNQAEMAQ